MRDDGSIRLTRMFCPAHDRNVPVLLRDPPPRPEAPSALGSPEPISCLDYGVRCTGWLCPHFALPSLPPRSLLEAAIEAERPRRGRVAGERRSILERALREGRARRARRDAPGAWGIPRAGTGEGLQPRP